MYGHRLFGPLPECATYLCQWDLDIGRIVGEVKPSFLLGLACFGQTFAYNLIDEDNAVPQEMKSKDLPDVTFVKLFVREVDVSLMSMSSATNISLKDGILLEFDNLINSKYSQRITIKMPTILTRFLANPDYARGATLSEVSEIHIHRQTCLMFDFLGGRILLGGSGKSRFGSEHHNISTYRNVEKCKK